MCSVCPQKQHYSAATLRLVLYMGCQNESVAATLSIIKYWFGLYQFFLHISKPQKFRLSQNGPVAIIKP